MGARKGVPLGLPDELEYGPGGLAVLYAEENSRDALFAAMRRREAYATSGTRPIVRVFGGFDLEPELCESTDRIAQGYARGVPMGGNLSAATEGARPRFMVAAEKDPGPPGRPGVDLQRIQMIKGWVDSTGETHEKVYEIAGNPDNGADVHPDTCEPRGAGFARARSLTIDQILWRAESSRPRMLPLVSRQIARSTLRCMAGAFCASSVGEMTSPVAPSARVSASGWILFMVSSRSWIVCG